MGLNVDSENKLDAAFSEIGEFGLFQILAISLICIPNIISASYVINFIFAIQPLNHRCKVPECDFGDNNREISYNQTWLEYAIPKTQNGYENCVRYESIQSSTANTCDVNSFNTSKQIECTEFIYATDELNIQTE
ncbi:solute carrier family 22 member 7-like, partial [Contarinia nasturtii]|uniref:solute carrier family 22 member 7-like n=1 Tax=Contarinia nasturtii TaxID=265458 RepID=UPI0012D405CF